MIQIQNLTKTFGAAGHEAHALEDVSIEVADGDIMGIIGMSGAGKSTLVRCINLLERPGLRPGSSSTARTSPASRAPRCARTAAAWR